MATPEPAGATATPPALPTLTWAMLRLGLVSLGGNNALLMTRMVVDRRRWLTAEQMDQAIATATISPGGNSSNLSYEVGRQIRGVAGGLLSYAAMAVPGIVIVLLFGGWILSRASTHIVEGALDGAQAAAVAMVAAVAWKLRKRSVHRVLDWVLVVALFGMVGVLGWSMEFCAPPAIAVAWLLRQRGA